MDDKKSRSEAAPMNGRTEGGDSGGGAYPNPHTGDEGKEGAGGFLGHGGQSNMAYHGHGRLGGKEVGGNSNAPAEDSEPDSQASRGKG